MTQLLIATKNPAKVTEFQNLLQDLDLELVTLADLGIKTDVDETEDSFQDNSKLKAVTYSQLTNYPVIADDGGMEIYKLNNEPGVKSRRWIDGIHEFSDDEIIGYILGRMYNFKGANRNARLRAIVTFALPDGQVWQEEGIVEGYIAQYPGGVKREGFPFRSVFKIKDIDKYYQDEELTPEEQKSYNHRLKAVSKLKKVIIDELC
ncbi:MAG: non-canonical purine NTP pyrophosphatase [bacterium]|nr:non-canonical purine NTP pyrophosphatase [bacterium]